MEVTELEFPSTDGVSTINAALWRAKEDAPVRGVVQVIHGMAEHKGRYLPFIEFLVDQGFVVCAHDHVGHGKTASTPDDYGHIPLRAPGNPVASGANPRQGRTRRLSGADILIADTHQLRCTMQEHLTDVPYVMFGHSMGSFVVRCYIARHGAGLAAAILCGTGQVSPLLSRGGLVITRILAALHGQRYRSSFVDSLGAGAYARKVSEARTVYDWISPERDAVNEYASDAACGFMFTVGGYAALAGLTLACVSPKAAAQVPKNLPLLFISGQEDPVGDQGKGVDAAVAEYRQAGLATVDERLYPGMRHEIVNRPPGATVREDVAAWLTEQGI